MKKMATLQAKTAEKLSILANSQTLSPDLIKKSLRLIDSEKARLLLQELRKNPSPSLSRVIRLLQYLALANQPITTELNASFYEWAGGSLQQLFKTDRPLSELWAFFSGPQKPAPIKETAVPSIGLPSLTMLDLATNRPDVLGSAGIDPKNNNQKYFFVKFLDPSDFPPFAYVGFNPETVKRLRQSAKEFRSHFGGLLWQDRLALEALADVIRPVISSREVFQRFKAAYKRWAVAESSVNWSGAGGLDWSEFLSSKTDQEKAQLTLSRQAHVRAQIAALMHRIDYKEGQAILIETPTLHAIAGLSIQIHPKAEGNFYPKDELWIYQPLALPDGTKSWILVEPQRTFDKTESGADFFTPFAWMEDKNRLGFRKSITPEYIRQFVQLMDAAPQPRAHYLRTAEPIRIPGSITLGKAQWRRLVDEPSWPYFIVRQLLFSGAGSSTIPLHHESFVELHATEGEVELTLENSGGKTVKQPITPTQAVFLPATLNFRTATLSSRSTATLHFFTRKKTR